MKKKLLARQALLMAFVFSNVCGTCPAGMDSSLPVGLATTILGQTGPPGPEGPQGLVGPAGPQGPPGPAGNNATVTAGTGVNVAAGEVSLDTDFTDGLYWKQGGNAGIDPGMQFIGTTDDQPLNIRVNNLRAMRLQYAESVIGDTTYRSSNTLVGFKNNVIDPGITGAFVAGGAERQDAFGTSSQINKVSAIYSSICGGRSNTIRSHLENGLPVGSGSTIAGGNNNSTDASNSFIGAGTGNQANGGGSFVGAGNGNFATGGLSFVGNGDNNRASGTSSTIPGGRENSAQGNYSFAGGWEAKAVHDGAFVWADAGGVDNDFSSTAPNQFCIRASGGLRLQKSNVLGTSLTSTSAALHVETFLNNGEGAWLRTAVPINNVNIPVLKLHRNPNGTNRFVEGINWDGGPTATYKFHIDANGAYNSGGDFAEALPTVGDKNSFEPGDVVVLSRQQPGFVEACGSAGDTHVAGVYSTRPGVIGISGNDETRLDRNDIPVAVVGIVPTKVCCESGPIQPGDLLVTSSTPGHAMRAKPVVIEGVEIYPSGAILGKALEGLEQGTGKIRVLVTLN